MASTTSTCAPTTPSPTPSEGALRDDAETTANIRILDPALVSRHVRPARAGEAVLPVPGSPRRRPVHDRRRDAGHRDRGARAQPGRPERRTPGSTTPSSTRTASAWSRPTATSARPTASRCSSSRASRSRARSAISSRASTSARTRPRYSIVGAPRAAAESSSTTPRVPAGGRGSSGSNAKTTFEGDGGPLLDNVFKKLVYAIKFQSEQIVLSGEVTDKSQILYDRRPDRAGARRSRRTSRSTATPTRPSSTAAWSGSSTATRPPPTTRTRASQQLSSTHRRHLHARARVPARRHQLHPQLGQGDGRRLRRLGHAVRVG